MTAINLVFVGFMAKVHIVIGKEKRFEYGHLWIFEKIKSDAK